MTLQPDYSKYATLKAAALKAAGEWPGLCGERWAHCTPTTQAPRLQGSGGSPSWGSKVPSLEGPQSSRLL